MPNAKVKTAKENTLNTSFYQMRLHTNKRFFFLQKHAGEPNFTCQEQILRYSTIRVETSDSESDENGVNDANRVNHCTLYR